MQSFRTSELTVSAWDVCVDTDSWRGKPGQWRAGNKNQNKAPNMLETGTKR